MPSLRAILPQLQPARRSSSACARSKTARGRPTGRPDLLVPYWRACWKPATTRSRITLRSNSAMVAMIEIFLVIEEVDTETAKFFEGHDQLFYATRKPIKSPDHDYIKLASPGIYHQAIQIGPSFLRAAYAVRIDPHKFPPALPDQLAEWFCLHLGVLIVSSAPSVIGLV